MVNPNKLLEEAACWFLPFLEVILALLSIDET